MPFPLLLAIPAIAGAAPGISAFLATVIGVGAGTGGAAIGAGSVWAIFHKRKKNQTPLPTTHENSLLEQEEITADRLNKANSSLSLLAQEAEALSVDVKEATAATTGSVDRLVEVSIQIEATNEKVKLAMQDAMASTQTLSATLPNLEGLSEETHQKVVTVISKLVELNELFTDKINSLIQTASDIKELRETVEKQGQAINGLGNTITKLKLENEQKNQTVNKKTQEVEQLKTLSIRLNDQCRFFKQHLSEQPIPGVGTEEVQNYAFLYSK